MFRKYRKKNLLSQEELAEEIGISTRHLQRLEQDEEKTRVSTVNYPLSKANGLPAS